MKKIITSLLFMLCLSGNVYSQHKKAAAAGGTVYPTQATPASGDSFFFWDASLNATTNFYFGDLQTVLGAAYEAKDADLTAIAALVDPNADRILFWDDSAGTYAYLTAGSGLTITGTTITASGGGGASLTPTDLAGGTTLAVNTWYFDTLALNRTMDDVDLIGVDGDQILWTFDVTGSTRSINFHTNSTVYRIGEQNPLTSVVNFPVGNHHLKLHKIDSKWWLTDSGIITEADRAFSFALSDETTDITIGTKLTWRAPFACTIVAVYAELTTASGSGTPTFDINKNGSTILSTKITVDATETDSSTAAIAPVISDTSLAARDRLTFDIDVAGSGADGAKITIVYTQP
jgi:hypothetical protein